MDILKITPYILHHFGKDDLYTFLAGSMVGLIYFLALITDISQVPLIFHIHDKYYATLFLVAACLCSTLIIYVLYLSLISLTEQKCEKKFKKEHPCGFEKKFSGSMNITIREEMATNAVHLQGLISCVLPILSPLPWVVLGTKHIVFCAIISFILLLFCYIFSKFIFFSKTLYPFYCGGKAIEQRKIKLTDDKKLWIDEYNAQVS